MRIYEIEVRTQVNHFGTSVLTSVRIKSCQNSYYDEIPEIGTFFTVRHL